MPQVTIIIPTHNTAAFIAETLDSVFAQTFSDFEVIVINDGSPETEQLEQVIAPYRERIMYLKQENRGPAAARNAGIRHARGSYLAFLDSDDCWLPDYLASQMRVFEDNPSMNVVYCDAQLFGDLSLVGKTFMQLYPSNCPVSLRTLIGKDCHIITSCTVALKQVVLDAGLFDESVRRNEDYDLWLRILYWGGRITYQKKMLGRYRTRAGSLSGDKMKMYESLAAVYEKTEKTMALDSETRRILKKQLEATRASFDLESGRKFLTDGDFDRAKHSLTKANKILKRAKLKLVIFGLNVAPRLTRWGAMIWQKCLS